MFFRFDYRQKLKWSPQPVDADLLQSTLSVLAHTFVPLKGFNKSEKSKKSEESESIENNEKVQFLINIWSAAIRCTDEHTPEFERLSNFASQVILEAHTHLVQGREEFLGVPLQLRILSEIFLQNAMEYVASGGITGGIEHLKEKISLSYIYKKFVDRKYNIFLSQKNGLPTASIADRHVSTHLDEHVYKMAGKVINFGDEYDSLIVQIFGKKLLYPDKSDIDDIKRVGIVFVLEDKETQDASKDFQFIHRTFAEFYSAKFLEKVINYLSCHGNNSFQEDAKLLSDIIFYQKDYMHSCNLNF